MGMYVCISINNEVEIISVIPPTKNVLLFFHSEMYILTIVSQVPPSSTFITSRVTRRMT